MLAMLAALAVATSAPNTEKPVHLKAWEACRMLQPQNCESTGDLRAEPEFSIHIRTFLSDRPLRYLYAGRLVRQVHEVLGGMPDDVVRKGDLFLFAGCRRHSCDEKGVMVLKSGVGIVALAILHTDCAEPFRPEDCANKDVLSIFVDHPHAPDKAVVDNLTAWTRDTLAKSYEPAQLIRVEVLPARP